MTLLGSLTIPISAVLFILGCATWGALSKNSIFEDRNFWKLYFAVYALIAGGMFYQFLSLPTYKNAILGLATLMLLSPSNLHNTADSLIFILYNNAPLDKHKVKTILFTTIWWVMVLWALFVTF